VVGEAAISYVNSDGGGYALAGLVVGWWGMVGGEAENGGEANAVMRMTYDVPGRTLSLFPLRS
jgi:hypothetical protein